MPGHAGPGSAPLTNTEVHLALLAYNLGGGGDIKYHMGCVLKEKPRVPGGGRAGVQP